MSTLSKNLSITMNITEYRQEEPPKSKSNYRVKQKKNGTSTNNYVCIKMKSAQQDNLINGCYNSVKDVLILHNKVEMKISAW